MPTMTDLQIIEDFRAAIESVGITPPNQIVADGKLRRFSTSGEKGDDSGWYVFHGDGIPAGAFGCWRSDIKQTWCAGKPEAMTDEERAAYRKRMEAIRRQREEDEKHRYTKVAKWAQQIWNAAKPASNSHLYLQRKGVPAHKLRLYRGSLAIAGQPVNRALIVPLHAPEGGVCSLEFITTKGQKLLLPGGRKRGAAYPIGTIQTIACIVEGWATGLSVWLATNYGVIIAFDAGNLEPVAKNLRSKYPTVKLMICADNDYHVDGKPNTGLLAAEKAAKAVNGILAVPPVLDGGKTDWNDVYVKQGPEAVKQGIEAFLPPKAATSGDTMDESDTVLETEQAATASLNGGPPEATILDEVHAFLGQFVAYPSEEARVAHTLWIGHTHLMDKWDSTPRIVFLSPEPGSGKTRALEITETLVPRPIEAINATPAYLFRKISDPNGLPTILYDEIDTIFGPRAKENEELRGVINAGHRPGAKAGRCVVKGKQVETEELPAYCAVAMAGLGNLPDTILSRSVIIRMRRRAPNEQVSPYRRKVHGKKGNIIRNKIEVWADEVRETIKTSPQLPEGIVDRNADVWEALIAVADAVGGPWPERARASAVSLVSASADDRGSLGLRLLTDLRTVFGSAKALFTVDLLTALHTLEESPWGELKGRPLDPHRLSTLLKPYGVQSKQVRIGEKSQKGYSRDDFTDAWLRYLPPQKSQTQQAVPVPAKAETQETDETQDHSLSSGNGETSETQETFQDSEEYGLPVSSTNGELQNGEPEEVIDL